MEDRNRALVVVEDEPDIRMMIKLWLQEDSRIEIHGEAFNVEETIELVRSKGPGLIILDHQLDGNVMGVDVAPLLHEAAPSAKILLFSAFDLRSAAEASPYIDEFLSKSEFAKLLPTVQRILGLQPIG